MSGLGPVEMLGAEMTAELQAQRDEAVAFARAIDFVTAYAKGHRAFEDLGCAGCHTPSLLTSLTRAERLVAP